MKIKIEKLKNSQRLISVEVEQERVESTMEGVYSDIQKKANIPGYRAGKAPRDLVETHYDKTAKDEALNRLVWDCYREAVKEEGLDAIGYPTIEDVKFEKGQPLTFTAKVDIRPEFKLRNYKGIRIKPKPAEVTDEDVDKALKNIQESMAQYKNIDPRPIAKGDYIIGNYECFADGKLIDKNDKLWLYINDQLQPKELLDILVGSEIGATKETEVSYPADYQYKELAGKKRLYKVTPKEIKEKILPEITDELAKETGHFKDLTELKKYVRENLERTKKQEAEQDAESQLYSSLLKSHSFEVPLSMVDRQAERLLEDTKHKLMNQGYKKEDIDKEGAKLKENMRPRAESNVRLYFIIEKISQQEKITVDEKELDERIRQIAANAKEDFSKTKKKLEDANLLESLNEQVLHDKVGKFLLEESKRI